MKALNLHNHLCLLFIDANSYLNKSKQKLVYQINSFFYFLELIAFLIKRPIIYCFLRIFNKIHFQPKWIVVKTRSGKSQDDSSKVKYINSQCIYQYINQISPKTKNFNIIGNKAKIKNT